jgi:TRAP-type C4-dicarboxylate transport system permease small subunit
MKAVLKILEKSLYAIIVVLFVGIVFATLAQVISRYVFNSPFMWTEELARYLGVWCVMLTVGVVLGEKLHIGLDYVIEMFPLRIKVMFHVLGYILISIFAGFLLSPGITLTLKVMKTKSPALRIPMGTVYLAVPVGCLLILIYALLGLWNSIVTLISTRKIRSKESQRVC